MNDLGIGIFGPFLKGRFNKMLNDLYNTKNYIPDKVCSIKMI